MIAKDYPYNLLREIPDIKSHIESVYIKAVLHTLDEMPANYKDYIELRYKKGMARTDCANRLYLKMHTVDALERKIHDALSSKFKQGDIRATSSAERNELFQKVMTLTTEMQELKQTIRDLASGKITIDAIQEPPESPQKIVDAVQKTQIEFLDFSVRTHMALKRNGCDTLADITQKTRDEFRKLRGVGSAVEKEVDNELKKHGLSFHNDHGPSLYIGYPYNLVRAIYLDDKNDDTHAKQIDKDGLIKSLETLTDREKELIQLRFEQQLTYQACGKKLNINPQKARNIIEKGVRKLRQSFRRKYYEKP